MWSFESKRKTLRDTMLLTAPEANPHEFVRRYMLARTAAMSSKKTANGDVGNAITLKPDREPVQSVPVA